MARPDRPPRRRPGLAVPVAQQRRAAARCVRGRVPAGGCSRGGLRAHQPPDPVETPRAWHAPSLAVAETGPTGPRHALPAGADRAFSRGVIAPGNQRCAWPPGPRASNGPPGRCDDLRDERSSSCGVAQRCTRTNLNVRIAQLCRGGLRGSLTFFVGPPPLAQSDTNPPFLEAIPRPVGHPPGHWNRRVRRFWTHHSGCPAERVRPARPVGARRHAPPAMARLDRCGAAAGAPARPEPPRRSRSRS